MPKKKEKTKKKKLTKKEREKLRKEVFKAAEKFKDRILRKYKGLIKTVFIFGSYLRDDFTEQSDLDVLVLLDDTKMRITENFKNRLWDEMDEIAKKIDKRLHLQPPWTITEFWDMVRIGHPLLHTILRDGWALYDEGFFIPMRKLLERGKLPATLEAVELLMASAPQKLSRAKKVKLYQVIEDCYYAMLNSSQAVLMYLGKPVPDPKNAPNAVKEYLVDTGLLDEKYYKMLQDVIAIRKKVEHGEIKEITGAEVDEWIKKAEEYFEQMDKILRTLRVKKKKDIIDRNYEVLLKSTVIALKNMGKLPPNPKDLPKAIKEELVDKNILPPSYLETFKRVIEMKKLSETENIDKIPERDIELTRAYVKKFVTLLGRYIESSKGKRSKGKSKK